MINYIFFKAIFVLIIIHGYPADQYVSQMNRTGYYCNCTRDNPACTSANISCATSDVTITSWIGLRYFGYGRLQNGTNCNSRGDSPLIPVPKGSECARNFKRDRDIINAFSGRGIGNNWQSVVSVYDHCNQTNAYFVSKYDCVPHHEKNDLKFDQLCVHNATLQALPVSSMEYPGGNITAAGINLCSCNLTVNSTGLVLRTYDNRLFENQTLTLSHRNTTLIKRWTIARILTDMMNTVTVPGPFLTEQLILNWENKNSSDGARLWIVIEAIDGLITTKCKPNTTGSSTTTTTPTLTSVPATSNSSNSSHSSLPSSLPSRVLDITAMSSNLSSTNSPSQIHKSASTTFNPTNLNTVTGSGTKPNMNTGSHINQSIWNTNPGYSSEPGGKVKIAAIIGGAVGGLFVLILLFLLCLFLCNKKKQKIEPERGTQPARNTFKTNRIVGSVQNGATKDGKCNDKISNEKSNAQSNSSSFLPPLPTGRSAISSSHKEENVTNVAEIGKLNQDLNAKLSRDVTKMSTDDLTPLTERTVNGETSMTENENTNASGQEEKRRKKKKKKKKKKKNTIEALLEQDEATNAEGI